MWLAIALNIALLALALGLSVALEMVSHRPRR